MEVLINCCKRPRRLFYGFEKITHAGELEEAADQVLLLLEWAHDAQNRPLQRSLIQNRTLADLAFRMILHLLIGVQLRRIRRQIDQLDWPARAEIRAQSSSA